MELCCDFFGHSLIKTLLDVLNYENISLFLSIIQENLYEICLTETGSRVIQKLIEKIQYFPILLNKFIFILNSKNMRILICSPYSSFVIQKYISTIKNNEYKVFLYDFIFNNFIGLVKEKHGVCVIQKMLLEADEGQRKKIFLLIIDNFNTIMKGEYSIYLIQYIFSKFEKRVFNEILPIIKKIEENILYYCKKKYSSSVIEKCFERGDKEISEHMINYLLDNYSNSIIDLLVNPYGFYVIKKSLNIKNKNLRKKMIKIIISNLDKIHNKNIANKIISGFSEQKEFAELFNKNNKNEI